MSLSQAVAEIKEVSDPETLRHVPGRLNVADHCLRGLSAQDLLHDSRWINSINFLLQGGDCWPNQSICQPPTDNDPEVKSEAWLGLSSEAHHEFLDPKKDLLVDPFSVSYLLGISVCDKLSSQE